MVLRRCPQCGSTSDDQYGFCIKCGYEFPKIDPTKKQCPLCGVENPDEAEFCVKCGTPLVLNNFNAQGKINPIIINKNAGAPVSAPAQGKWTRLICFLNFRWSYRINPCTLFSYKKRPKPKKTRNYPACNIRILCCSNCCTIRKWNDTA